MTGLGSAVPVEPYDAGPSDGYVFSPKTPAGSRGRTKAIRVGAAAYRRRRSVSPGPRAIVVLRQATFLKLADCLFQSFVIRKSRGLPRRLARSIAWGLPFARAPKTSRAETPRLLMPERSV